MTLATQLKNTMRVYEAPRRSRLPAVILLFCAVFTIVIFSLAHPVHDFVEYWTAAHLAVNHLNPYSLAEVFKMERAAGFEQTVPIMLLSPPWTLTLLAPIGFSHSYALACFFWMLALIGAVAWSSRMIMDVYFRELQIPEISDAWFYRSLFAFTFYPVLLCLRYSQTAPLMLLGVAGFIYFEKRRQDILAGVFLSLTLIKPQLLYLVWIALLLQSIQRLRWKLLASIAGFVVLLSAIALLLDPQAFQHYKDLASSPYIQAYASGVTAAFRKLTSGVGSFWFQLVPPVIGLIWFAAYWSRHHKDWEWAENLPMLITISVLTSAYGWLFDQTLLALPIIALAAKHAWREGKLPFKLVTSYTVLNCVLMIVMPFPTLNLLPAPVFIVILLMRESRTGGAVENEQQTQLSETS